MKNLINIILMLCGIICACNAQTKTPPKVSSVKAKLITYKKEIYQSGTGIYTNIKNKKYNPSEFRSLFDQDASISLPKNQTILKCIKKVFTEDQLRNPDFQKLMITFVINRKGAVEELSFVLPKNSDITPMQLELLEESLKNSLKANVNYMDVSKKYCKWTIAIFIPQILNNTYPY